MGCTQSKDAEDSAAERRNRELQRSLEQVRGRFAAATTVVARFAMRSNPPRLQCTPYGNSVRKKNVAQAGKDARRRTFYCTNCIISS